MSLHAARVFCSTLQAACNKASPLLMSDMYELNELLRLSRPTNAPLIRMYLQTLLMNNQVLRPSDHETVERMMGAGMEGQRAERERMTEQKVVCGLLAEHFRRMAEEGLAMSVEESKYVECLLKELAIIEAPKGQMSMRSNGGVPVIRQHRPLFQASQSVPPPTQRNPSTPLSRLQELRNQADKQKEENSRVQEDARIGKKRSGRNYIGEMVGFAAGMVGRMFGGEGQRRRSPRISERTK